MDECDRGQRSSDHLLRTGVAIARKPLYDGPGLIYCEDCGEKIPERRREMVPGCIRCVECQEIFERVGRL